jgi:hypothetical protein
MPNPNGNPKGRPKGVPNKRSQKLLHELEHDHNFHVAKELIELYGANKVILLSLIEKIHENKEKDKPLTFGLSEEEIDIYSLLTKEQTGILIRLLAYLYPKLKAMEVGAGTGDKVVFNISGMPDFSNEKKSKDKPEESTSLH